MKNFIILFTIWLYSVNLSAQITIIAHVSSGDLDSNKYFYNPFVEAGIKSNAFKDGSYIFYSDDARKLPFFKGIIKNGKTTGYYYKYHRDSNSYLDGVTSIIKVKEGELDSICALDAVEDNNIKVLYHLKTGILTKICIVDPFFRNFYENYNYYNHHAKGPEDSLNLIFNKDQLQSMDMYIHDTINQVSPEIQTSNMDQKRQLDIKDTSGINKLKNTKALGGPESNQAVFQKKFPFDVGFSYNNQIALEFDSSRKLISIKLITGFPISPQDYHNKIVLFELEMNGFILKKIHFSRLGKSFTSYIDEQGNERLLFSEIEHIFNVLSSGLLEFQ